MTHSFNVRLALYTEGPFIDHSTVNFRAYSMAFTILALLFIPTLSPCLILAPLLGRAIDYLEAPAYDIEAQLQDLNATSFTALIRMGIGHTIPAVKNGELLQKACEKLSTTELIRDATRQLIVPMWRYGAVAGALIGMSLKLSSSYMALTLPAMITTVQLAALVGIAITTLMMASDIYNIVFLLSRQESVNLIYSAQISAPKLEVI